VINRARS